MRPEQHIDAGAGQMLRDLARAGWLECVWDDEEGEAFAICGLFCDESLSTSPLAGPAPVELAEHAFIRRTRGRLVVESPLSDASVEVARPALLFGLLAGGTDRPRSPSERQLVAALSGCGLIVPASQLEGAPATELTGGGAGIWEFHDLLFHRRSRPGIAGRRAGATFRFGRSLRPDPAGRVPSCIEGWTSLESPPRASPPTDFYTVLHARRSIRPEVAAPPSLEQLGAVLWHSARARVGTPSRAASSEAPESTSRPYPSGGACYALELYPCIHGCVGLETGLFYYDPLRHRLGRIPGGEALALAAVEAARRSAGFLPTVVILVTARFLRVMWKYEAIAYSLVLKDLGCLFQTLYLVATEQGLSPCALGMGLRPTALTELGVRELDEEIVGEFALSGPETPHPR